MTAVTFDTHKLIRELTDVGFEERQAEAFIKAFKEAQDSADVATKQDIHDLGREINDLRKDMEAKFEKFELRLTIKFGLIIAAAITLAPSIAKLLHLPT